MHGTNFLSQWIGFSFHRNHAIILTPMSFPIFLPLGANMSKFNSKCVWKEKENVDKNSDKRATRIQMLQAFKYTI